MTILAPGPRTPARNLLSGFTLCSFSNPGIPTKQNLQNPYSTIRPPPAADQTEAMYWQPPAGAGQSISMSVSA